MSVGSQEKPENRWPMTLAVLVVIVLTAALPERIHVLPRWVAPGGITVLLISLIVTDPGAITKRSNALRVLSIALVSVLVGSVLSNTVYLIRDLTRGSSVTESSSVLLQTGGAVWIMNIVAFSLLYWEFDCGGPAMRARRMAPFPDFAFPQQLSPELAPDDWRPRYVDYLYVGVTNAVAFSPTDTMPMARWAKMAMAVQAIISLAILALVVARAVNAFR